MWQNVQLYGYQSWKHDSLHPWTSAVRQLLWHSTSRPRLHLSLLLISQRYARGKQRLFLHLPLRPCCGAGRSNQHAPFTKIINLLSSRKRYSSRSHSCAGARRTTDHRRGGSIYHRSSQYPIETNGMGLRFTWWNKLPVHCLHSGVRMGIWS